MEVIINKDFKPEIKKKEIKFLKCDYELHLSDLENLKVTYYVLEREVSADFDSIYVDNMECLIKLNHIYGSYKYYSLNGFYNNTNIKFYNVTIGQDIIDYLYEKEKKFLETHDITKIKESFVEI